MKEKIKDIEKKTTTNSSNNNSKMKNNNLANLKKNFQN